MSCGLPTIRLTQGALGHVAALDFLGAEAGGDEGVVDYVGGRVEEANAEADAGE